MNTIFKIFLALLATAITPAILAGVMSQSKDFLIIVFVIAFLHLLLLGIPAFIWGYASKLINLRSILSVAFLVGACPSTLLLLIWPRYAPYSSADFLEELRFVTVLGLSGLFGGVVFWLIWHFWIQTDLQDEK